MDTDPQLDEGNLPAILADAEAAARRAAEALIRGRSLQEARLREHFATIADYCSTCPDPFLALDIARLLRALVDDIDASAWSRGSLTEWAYAEVRIQALAARIARVLRDQRAEQALVDLAVLHLRALEEGPQYPRILAEMTRISDAAAAIEPMAPTQEFFGLARRGITLPTQPPPEDRRT